MLGQVVGLVGSLRFIAGGLNLVNWHYDTTTSTPVGSGHLSQIFHADFDSQYFKRACSFTSLYNLWRVK